MKKGKLILLVVIAGIIGILSFNIAKRNYGDRRQRMDDMFDYYLFNTWAHTCTDSMAYWSGDTICSKLYYILLMLYNYDSPHYEISHDILEKLMVSAYDSIHIHEKKKLTSVVDKTDRMLEYISLFFRGHMGFPGIKGIKYRIDSYSKDLIDKQYTFAVEVERWNVLQDELMKLIDAKISSFPSWCGTANYDSRISETKELLGYRLSYLTRLREKTDTLMDISIDCEKFVDRLDYGKQYYGEDVYLKRQWRDYQERLSIIRPRLREYFISWSEVCGKNENTARLISELTEFVKKYF